MDDLSRLMAPTTSTDCPSSDIDQLAVAALNAITDGLWVATADGSAVLQNPVAAALDRASWSCGGSARTPRELLGDPMLRKAVHARGRWVAECDVIDATAGARKVLVEILPLKDPDQQSVGLVLRSRDVSEEHFREEVLQARNQELQQAHAHASELQGQLLHAEKMAGLGQLAAGVAHEINNPAAFVRSNLNTLKEYFRDLLSAVDAKRSAPGQATSRTPAGKAVPTVDLAFLREDIHALFAETGEGIDRICRIVSDLGEFAQAGRSHDEWNLADIEEGIRITLKLAAGELHRERIEVQLDFAELPLIECLPAQINQMFLDLLVNAAQSITANGGIKIRTEALGAEICVSVIDSGCGIAAVDLPRVFEPFFTTRGVGATGLGLTVAYGIVQRHRGRIEIESEPGQGTCVRVWLPTARALTEAGEP